MVAKTEFSKFANFDFLGPIENILTSIKHTEHSFVLTGNGVFFSFVIFYYLKA